MRRTVVVTGASSGIGLAAAVALARSGDDVVLIGRDPRRLADAVSRVREAGGRTPASYRADFAVLDEVRAAGQAIAAGHERVDVLANNAGLLTSVRRPTTDGHDPTMQINHLAGFLLTHLLLDRLRAAATPRTPARVVTTTSLAEVWGTLDVDRPGRRQFSRWPGGYFAWRDPFTATGRSTDPARAQRLWQSSLAAVGHPADLAS